MSGKVLISAIVADDGATSVAPLDVAYIRDYLDIAEPGTFEIDATAFLEIDETDGPNALICYSVRVHPYSNQCLAETSSLQVLDYYEITEPYTFEIPATALVDIIETAGARDFDIS